MSLFLVPLDRQRGLVYGWLALAEAAWLTGLTYTFIEPLISVPVWFFSALALIVVAVMLGWLTEIYGLPFAFSRVLGFGVAIIGLLVLIYQAVYAGRTTTLAGGWFAQFLRTLIIEPDPARYSIFLLCFLTTIYIWWRCLSLGFNVPEPATLSLTLRLGSLGFVLAYIGGSTRYFPEPSPILLFLFVGSMLLGFSLGYSQIINQHHGVGAAGSIGLRLLNGAGILALFSLIAFSLIAILSPALLSWVLRGLTILFFLALSPLINLLIWLLSIIGPWFDAFFDWLQSMMGEVVIENQATESGEERAEPRPPEAPPEPIWWLRYVGWGWRTLLVLSIVWLFYRLISRLAPRRSLTVAVDEAQQSSTVSVDDGGLGDLWGTAKDRLESMLNMVRRFGLGSDLRAALAIRRIYAALVSLATAHNVSRMPSQTPSEFVDPLTTAWPHLAAEFQLITDAYNLVHYGELPDGEAGVQAVREAWQTVYEAIIQNYVDNHGQNLD